MPLILEGPEGEQFNIYPGWRNVARPQVGKWPFGTQLLLQDGRKYRFAKAGGTDLVIGNVIQSAANIPNHVDTTAAANAVDVRTLTTTLGATLASLDQYFQGYAIISVAPGSGQVYFFDTTPAVASAGSFVGTLAAGHAIRVALTTTSRVDLIKNPYHNVIQAPATTLTSSVVGVAVSIIVTSETGNVFGWLQTRGPAAPLIAGTTILGNVAVSPTGTAGACGPAAATPISHAIGTVTRVAATTAWGTVFLIIDG